MSPSTAVLHTVFLCICIHRRWTPHCYTLSIERSAALSKPARASELIELGMRTHVGLHKRNRPRGGGVVFIHKQAQPSAMCPAEYLRVTCGHNTSSDSVGGPRSAQTLRRQAHLNVIIRLVAHLLRSVDQRK